MNTMQLQAFLQIYNAKGGYKHTVGVYSAENLPQTFSKPAAFIANTDESHLPGTHWVAFYFPKKGPAEYFDSYAQDPLTIHHLKFMHKKSKNWKNNTTVLQDLNSKVCGQYASLYLASRMAGNSMNKFLKLFTANAVQNDEIVKKTFKKLANRKVLVQNGGQVCC
jgi:oligoribonuclease NrnB/cAMP/cGMP phosphodiesterase (DHH superfamily)